ncbi:hypothetical protein JZK55_22160 [Dissulfurispira thermophila]|uniref:Putative restriction endonuclease domain-containing protein n=1 Tax=Dissulfurispira thermophila TaxID=2715679 RepID=A0A7G1H3A2_9BACT|nr:Uma2 family endonuclease [Dissulfurispira thermophila]BCB97294.1 hypothetical protein JZK55_22160 [Dissulfurispira thermophila]
MAYPQKKEAGKKYTWQDYLTWPDEKRWEVIDGEAYPWHGETANMSPSPSLQHQIATGNFYGILRTKLLKHRCRVFVAPLDVYFDDYNFVQPDVFIVCDRNKIRDKIYGAPDLTIEVISPYTALKDKRTKKMLYERFGVREYILVYPEELFVERYCLIDNRYGDSEVFGPQEILPLCSLEGIEVALWEVFEVEQPQSEQASNK